MRERELQRRAEEERRRSEEEEKGMVNRIMLARMHTLEEGFREVLKEIKDLSQNATNSSRRDSEVDSGGAAVAPAAAVGGRSSKPPRPKIDTQDPGGSGWQTPKTPIGRIGGNEKDRSRRSPRKVLVPLQASSRGARKGKENERPSSGEAAANVNVKVGISEEGLSAGLSGQRLVREEQAGGGEDVAERASPQSVKSVIEVGPEHKADEESAAARPQTAVRPKTAVRDDERSGNE